MTSKDIQTRWKVFVFLSEQSRYRLTDIWAIVNVCTPFTVAQCQKEMMEKAQLEVLLPIENAVLCSSDM